VSDFVIVLVLVVVLVLEGYGGTRNVLRLSMISEKYAPSILQLLVEESAFSRTRTTTSTRTMSDQSTLGVVGVR
jgi:hypothetical protein